MGQKVNPVGMRVGVIRNWDSRWYADKSKVPALVKEDALIRQFLNEYYKNAAVSHIEIERVKGKGGKDRVKLTVHTAKPGVVIGRDAVTKKIVVGKLEKLTAKEIIFNVVEVRRPERVATLVAQSVAQQLENRASFRRVQKIAISRALKCGAKGARTLVSGRLGGAEMARSEGYSEGQVPLHTLRADIDYAVAEAHTTYGILGVKVWIYNGEVLPGQTREENLKKEFERGSRNNRSRRNNNRRNNNNPNAKGGR
ncbi:30S ribosomal protein S3 [Mycoplasmatota bacterium]|nr:30S ribosomal protein S3 [Mycoplasmatota bacterium]